MCQVYVIAHKKVSIARHKFDNLPKISQKKSHCFGVKISYNKKFGYFIFVLKC
ncbi:hypothetical protein AO364_1828 [Moraxella catarrhalis]|nr:hypothetical protein AO364_1828 [Moraxella catarrhalis]